MVITAEPSRCRSDEVVDHLCHPWASILLKEVAATLDGGVRLPLCPCHLGLEWCLSASGDRIAIAEGRQGMMPPMAAAVGSAEDVKNVANYVLSLSGSAHDSIRAQLGKSKFGACAACHGADGKGMQAMGAPNLTDKVWLHGWGEAAVIAMINNGKTNVMPQHASRLSPEQIKVLAAYVWSLSHKGDKQTALAPAGDAKAQ